MYMILEPLVILYYMTFYVYLLLYNNILVPRLGFGMVLTLIITIVPKLQIKVM